ncbi:MAG: sterol desaturase family protein [Thalassotalea sp.]
MYEYTINLLNQLIEPVTYLLTANKRIYWLYLISALLLIVLFYRSQPLAIKTIFKQLVSRKYWFNRSTQLDLKWIFLNQALALLLVVPIISGQLAWAIGSYKILLNTFGAGDFIHWPSIHVLWAFTLVTFIADDFSRFLMHYAYHKVPFLWRFHAVHHSAKIMTPLTLYRIHFIEYLLNSCRSLLVIGTISGIFIYCFNGRIGVYEILGVSILNLLFNLAGANLRHSHIAIGFGKLEQIFISPAQHQIHHSSAKTHLDKNFGATFAIWDKLFGSWISSKNQKVRSFGLYRQWAKQSMKSQLLGIRPKQ